MADEKRFTLQVLGADEDYPRLIRGYGKACGGRFGVVLSPRQSTGILIHAVKDKAGEHAHVWTNEAQNDVVTMPTTPAPFKDAVAAMQAMAKEAPSRGPVSYRGRWKAVLICRGMDVPPELVLTRKVAAYASFSIHSHGDHYRVTLVRDPKWFSQALRNEDADEHYTNLEAAIGGAYAALIGVVRSACGFRDTKRRAELDQDYAGKHPPHYAKPPARNPLERAEADAARSKGPKEPKPEKIRKLPTKVKKAVEGEPHGRGQKLVGEGREVVYLGLKGGRGKYAAMHRLGIDATRAILVHDSDLRQYHPPVVEVPAPASAVPDRAPHLRFEGDHVYADTNALNAASSVGITIDHVGFGDFKAKTPHGEVYFGRTEATTIPGGVGRVHRLDGPKDAVAFVVEKLQTLIPVEPVRQKPLPAPSAADVTRKPHTPDVGGIAEAARARKAAKAEAAKDQARKAAKVLAEAEAKAKRIGASKEKRAIAGKDRRYKLYELVQTGKVVGWDIVDTAQTDPEKSIVETVHIADYKTGNAAKGEARKREMRHNRLWAVGPPKYTDAQIAAMTPAERDAAFGPLTVTSLETGKTTIIPTTPTKADIVAAARASHTIGAPEEPKGYSEWRDKRLAQQARQYKAAAKQGMMITLAGPTVAEFMRETQGEMPGMVDVTAQVMGGLQKLGKAAKAPKAAAAPAASDADKDAAMDKRMDELLGKYLGAS